MAVDQRRTRCGGVQAQDEPHRGGLAGAVRAEKAGHVAGADGEAQAVHRADRAETLAQPVHLDHGRVPVKKALELRCHKCTTAATPISQTTNQKTFTRAASGTRRLPNASTVAIQKSTVPVIRAQFLPRRLARARMNHRAAPTRPPTIQPTINGSSCAVTWSGVRFGKPLFMRSEEHTSELQSREKLVCRLLLEKKKKK